MAHRAPYVGDHDLRYIERQTPLDQQRIGTLVDGRSRELVPVEGVTTQAREHLPGPDGT